MENYRMMFPGVDGNRSQREGLLQQFREVLRMIDSRKDRERTVLAGELQRNYGKLLQDIKVPEQGIAMKELFHHFDEMIQGNPCYNHRNFINAIPTPAIPSLVGMLISMMLNNNAIWDVLSPAAAEAELKVTAMMAKVIGYDANRAGGYFTYGGQGGVLNGLRIGMEKAAPGSRVRGIPANLYCFASEQAHFSLRKAAELGIGTEHVISVKANKNDEMDLVDLAVKMEEVIRRGGRIALVLATTGTTDSFGIDSVAQIKQVINQLVQRHHLPYIPHLHADGAMGGMYSVFNSYDFQRNPLQFDEFTLSGLEQIAGKLAGLKLADSLSIDFHKLGQCPYNTSMFMVKDAADFQLIGMDMEHCPYLGEQNYGSYFTNYTLECSRMGSAMAAYANLMAFGLEGYQAMLGQFVACSNLLRERLSAIPHLKAVATNPGPVTLIRAYKSSDDELSEESGQITSTEIAENNYWTSLLIEEMRENRQHFMFGDTSKYKQIVAIDDRRLYPLNALKVFFNSPLTQSEDVEEAVRFIKNHFSCIQNQYVEKIAV